MKKSDGGRVKKFLKGVRRKDVEKARSGPPGLKSSLSQKALSASTGRFKEGQKAKPRQYSAERVDRAERPFPVGREYPERTYPDVRKYPVDSTLRRFYPGEREYPAGRPYPDMRRYPGMKIKRRGRV
jgi:hypothetical protein